MSYRLIDANALAMSCAEVNDLPCIYADLPNGLDGGHYDMAQGSAGKSRWFQLFGTPERAARTLVDNCDKVHFCEGCPADMGIHDCTYDALLGWLKGGVE